MLNAATAIAVAVAPIWPKSFHISYHFLLCLFLPFLATLPALFLPFSHTVEIRTKSRNLYKNAKLRIRDFGSHCTYMLTYAYTTGCTAVCVWERGRLRKNVAW